jgi:hypothetical protein
MTVERQQGRKLGRATGTRKGLGPTGSYEVRTVKLGRAEAAAKKLKQGRPV